MVDHRTKIGAVFFIDREIERVLKDLESGTINKDQGIGSLNTLFNISSGIEDTKHMQLICRIITYLRSTNLYVQLKKMYLNRYFHESDSPIEETSERVRIPSFEKIIR
ncbi:MULTISPECIES: hypothetical protein [Paenibacillus]|uniref:Uncharacterized protein n=2 Tax=Paenibacillus TaxID=44249 RepID=A0A1V4HF36_9BACL|nr:MULTISPECIES: hypothetical protein [Paenibacillus]MEC0226675.1 hypothetical protein [Paenibacillus alba]NQX67784.1 hypothetical protein [Paenibacillus alba]OPH53438.1 hypothetical protein BC351_06130 [Paenibacillus ferrarius]